jgi:hypothetical protein
VAPLASVDDLAAWPGCESIPAGQADLALAVASGVIRAECGWSITAELASWSGVCEPGSASVWLPTLLLTDVSAVSVDGLVVPPGGFAWSSRGRVSLAGRSFLPSVVSVSYTHGYAITPDAVRGVCLQLAARSVLNPGLLRSQVDTVGSVTESRTYAVPATGSISLLTDADRLALSPFRLTGVA